MWQREKLKFHCNPSHPPGLVWYIMDSWSFFCTGAWCRCWEGAPPRCGGLGYKVQKDGGSHVSCVFWRENWGGWLNFIHLEVTKLRVLGQISVISRSLGLLLYMWKIMWMFCKAEKLEEKHSTSEGGHELASLFQGGTWEMERRWDFGKSSSV